MISADKYASARVNITRFFSRSSQIITAKSLLLLLLFSGYSVVCSYLLHYTAPQTKRRILDEPSAAAGQKQTILFCV